MKGLIDCKKDYAILVQSVFGKTKLAWLPHCLQDLIEDIKSELSGDYKELVMALFVSPAEYDAWCIKEAIYVSTAGEKERFHYVYVEGRVLGNI